MGERNRARDEILLATTREERLAAMERYWLLGRQSAWDDVWERFDRVAGPLEATLPVDAPLMLFIAHLRDALATQSEDDV